MWGEGCDAIDVIILQCVKKDDLERNKVSGRMHCTGIVVSDLLVSDDSIAMQQTFHRNSNGN